jgi:type II secretory pathway pseudopilin PulG
MTTRCNRSRKGQIKLFESIAVLVVFAFLLVFGVNFYFTMQQTSVEREIARQQQLRVFSLAQKAAFLPELDCAIAGIQQEACIDVSKLRGFADVLQSPDAVQLYFPVFGWSTVTVTQIFPPKEVFRMSLYSNELRDQKSANRAQVPILIFNATTQNYGFGVIEVTAYEK